MFNRPEALSRVMSGERIAAARFNALNRAWPSAVAALLGLIAAAPAAAQDQGEGVTTTESVVSATATVSEMLQTPVPPTRKVPSRPFTSGQRPNFVDVDFNLPPEGVSSVSDSTGGIAGVGSTTPGSLSAEFAGPSFNGFFVPDPSIAVGPNTVLIAINGAVAAFSRTGEQLWRVADFQFFSPINTDASYNAQIRPRVLYDSVSQRFFIMQLGVNVDDSGTIGGSFYLFAVSKTSQPNNSLTDSWTLIRNQNDQAGSFSAFSGFSVDAGAVYASADYFDGETFQYAGSHVRVFGKSQFLGTGVTQLTFSDNQNITDFNATPASGIMPAVNYDQTNDQYFVSSSDFTANPANPRRNLIYLYSINGITGPRTVRRYQVNISQLNNLGNYAPPPLVTAAGSNAMETGGLRILNAVRVNNEIWATHTVADATGANARCRWYRIAILNATQVGLVDQGVVQNPGGSTFVPGICANKFGDAVLFFTKASVSEFPSMYYSWRQFDSPGGFMSVPLLVEPGANGFDGQFWGEYAQPALDPSDNSTIWGFHMLTDQSKTWTTRIASVALTFGPGGGGGPQDPCSSALSFTTPLGGENLITGVNKTIKWTFSGAGSDPIDIFLVKGNTILGSVVSNFAVGSNEFAWNVGTLTPAQSLASGSDYRLLMRPTFCNLPVSLTPNFFTITRAVQANAEPPEATLPQGGGIAQVTLAPGESVVLGGVDGQNQPIVAQFGAPPYSYEWTPPNFLNNPTLARPTATPSINMTYTLKVRDATGTEATDQVRVVIGNPLRVDAGPNKTFQIGGTVLLEGSASGGTPPYHYEWAPAPDADDPGTAMTPQPIARPSNPTVYTFRVTDAANTIVTDTVSAVPGLSLTIVNDPGNGGLVSRDVIKNLYAPGDQIMVHAVPNPGFVFTRWDAPGPEFVNRPTNGSQFTQNPTQLIVQTSDISIKAVYTPLTPSTTIPTPIVPGMTGCGTLMPQALAGMVLGFGFLRRRFVGR